MEAGLALAIAFVSPFVLWYQKPKLSDKKKNLKYYKSQTQSHGKYNK